METAVAEKTTDRSIIIDGREEDGRENKKISRRRTKIAGKKAAAREEERRRVGCGMNATTMARTNTQQWRRGSLEDVI